MLILAVGVFLLAGCSEIQKPQAEPFYSAETVPPSRQEFRWSNGKTPRSFDPARAAAAPETDIVRALFEGLTEIDARTLKEVPAVAERWIASDDFREWTFQLRRDARWSNGERVTAYDFVTSWKRLGALGEKAAHRELFQNIAGLRTSKKSPEPSDLLADPVHSAAASGEMQQHNVQPASTPSTKSQGQVPFSLPTNSASASKGNPATTKPTPEKFGVEAIDESTLRVSLELPDKDFSKLVANPIFRPIYGDGTELETGPLDVGIVTNGAFKVAGVGKDGILLDRSETYWNKSSVKLERVRFVPKDSAETALDAYRKGEIDAVTNAEFEPLALKLLAPYDDFRQTTHSALNFYEFNTAIPPFNDRRVREALAISIDRERLTDGELGGAAQPAASFLPLGDKKNARLLFDPERAKTLLESAGFANDGGFPKIRLLINRNDTQQRVARAVARMWKRNLNLDTEIIVKELSDIEVERGSGDYDLIRRGLVLPTVDETVSMAAIFGMPVPTISQQTPEKTVGQPLKASSQTPVGEAQNDRSGEPAREEHGIVTEEEAIYEVNAIPLYFPVSYSLVKPYVRGFESNGLDPATLNNVTINSNWQPKAAGRES